MNRFISLGEVRLGLRLIVKQPILSLTIILALATGICFATMGFTMRDAMVNGVLPYAAGDRFVRFNVHEREGDRRDMDMARYRLFLEKASTLEHVGAAAGRPFSVVLESGEVETVRGALITPRTMPFIEASPILGRTLIPADGASGAERVALIRDSYWKRRYAGDPNIVGRQIDVGGYQRAIVGVMPDTFEFPTSGELWLPLDDLTLGGSLDKPADSVRVFGVRRSDATLDAVSAEIDTLSRQVSATEERGLDIRVETRPFTTDSDQAATAMTGLVVVLVLLLLVVASNVATLVFARTWARGPELAVRTALGAARTRVVGQLFVEVLILGSIAAVIGLAGVQVALRYFERFATEMPFWLTFQPSLQTMAFVVFLTLLVSVVSGMWPALRVTRHDLRNSLQAGRGFAAGGFGRIGAALMIVEIALSVALLNGAVTMVRAFDALTGDVPALPHGQVLTAHIGRIQSPEMRDQVVAAAAQLPGVEAAGAADMLPRLFARISRVAVEPVGDEPVMAPAPAPSHAAGLGFLETISSRVVSGRLFTAADYQPGAAPVAVVNEPFVAKFLAGRNPIGRRIRIEGRGSDEAPEPWREIVGVVPDLGLSIGDPVLAGGFYVPASNERLYYLALRTTGDPLSLISPLRKAIAGVNPDLQAEEFMALEDVGWDERAFLIGIASSLTAMGGMALMLSIVGIYALLSFVVTRRTREIGIRVALGARSWQVLRTVTGGAAVYLALGGAFGSALGIAFVQMRSLILISIPEPGFWMPATIFLTLALAGGIACWMPTRRALSIRPAEALNAD
jgi:putative ABC transport system permease protein